jgi:hypothetical protein
VIPLVARGKPKRFDSFSQSVYLTYFSQGAKIMRAAQIPDLIVIEVSWGFFPVQVLHNFSCSLSIRLDCAQARRRLLTRRNVATGVPDAIARSVIAFNNSLGKLSIYVVLSPFMSRKSSPMSSISSSWASSRGSLWGSEPCWARRARAIFLR